MKKKKVTDSYVVEKLLEILPKMSVIWQLVCYISSMFSVKEKRVPRDYHS